MPINSRRTFLVSSVGASLWLSNCRTTSSGTLAGPTAGPSPVVTRKDLATLNASSPEIIAYRKAIVEMRKLDGAPKTWTPRTVAGKSGLQIGLVTPRPEYANTRAFQSWPADGRSWFRQAAIHWDNCAHNSWAFLPWHRAYILHFEKLIRHFSGDDTFALPYWDWSNDAALPNLFGDLSSELYLAGRRVSNPLIPASSAGLQAVRNVVSTLDWLNIYGPGPGTGVPQASTMLETGPHGAVHVAVSGEMQAFMSPLDPIFWMHHCNIDRIWESWRNYVKPQGGTVANFDLPRVNLNAWMQVPLTGFYDVAGNPSQMKPADVVDITALGYVYDRTTLGRPVATGNAPSAAPVLRSPTNAAGWSEDYQYISLTAPTSAATSPAPANGLPEGNIEQMVEAIKRSIRYLNPDAALNLSAPGTTGNPTIRMILNNVPAPSSEDQRLLVTLIAKNSQEAIVGVFSFFGQAHHGGAAVSFLADVTEPMASLFPTISTQDLMNLKVKATLIDLADTPLSDVTGFSVNFGFAK